MAKTSRESFKFMLRLPDELRDKLRQTSDESGRSVTAEIIARLEASFHDSVMLPEALASRVGSYASDHGRTLGEEVVRVLEQKFPAPRSPDDRFAEVLAILGGLQSGAETDSTFARFSVEVLRTLRDISQGEIKVDKDTKARVSEALSRWEQDMNENGYLQYTENMDPEELEKFERTGDDSIIVDPVFKEDEK
jgi:plasmid stability protein